ncbi:protein misato homolog 1-like [Ornithodoros turicata]|uniref:protein misato homolog 1-like n=1 Tax=Ornithodoros turicata TaxID=34597 RepID=UPI0031386C10
MSREVISLQLGHYANYVGSHIWNLQESCFSYDQADTKIPHEFNHDVFYREGLSPRGKFTYAPRLLLVDLRGSLKSLRQEGSLYDPLPSPAKEYICWSEKVTIHKTEPERKPTCTKSKDEEGSGVQHDEDKDVCRSEVPQTSGRTQQQQQLENNVEVWSDFLQARLHSRSIHLLQDYVYENKDPLDQFGLGLQVCESTEWHDGFLNHLRQYVEECDCLQAFNVMFDAYDGFAGLCNGLLEHIDDEYPRKSSLCWPLFQPHYRILKEERATMEAAFRNFNAVMCYDSLSRLSSAFCPLSVSESQFEPKLRPFPHLTFQENLPYHTSAILAAALDNMWSGLKLKNDPLSIPELIGQLTGYGRKALALGSAFPMGLAAEQYVADWKEGCSVSPLTPGVPARIKPSDRSSVSFAVIRGLPGDMISRVPAHIEARQEALFKFVDRHCHDGLMLMRGVQNPSRTHSPFPSIFGSAVSSEGLILPSGTVRSKPGVDQVPSLTTLSCNESAGSPLHEAIAAGSKLRLSKLHRCVLTGTETDSFNEALNRVQELAYAYES